MYGHKCAIRATAFIFIQNYVCLHACMYICIRIYIYVYMCTCMYGHINRGRQLVRNCPWWNPALEAAPPWLQVSLPLLGCGGMGFLDRKHSGYICAYSIDRFKLIQMYIYTYIHTCIYIYTHINTYAWTCIYIYRHGQNTCVLYICIYICRNTHLYRWMCICLYTYLHRHRLEPRTA